MPFWRVNSLLPAAGAAGGCWATRPGAGGAGEGEGAGAGEGEGEGAGAL